MALAVYVNPTLDGLLNEYINKINRLKGLTTDDFVRRTLDADIETYSEIIRGMKRVSQQFEGQLDPKVNKDLGDILVNFISKALKDNENPSQLYRIILDAYNQEVFSKGYEALVILLSKIYWEALITLGVPDPINRQKYFASREAKETAAMIIPIVKELLGEALYEYWSSKGKKITKEEIMANLEEHARPFYAAWEAVKGKIVNEIERLTPNREELRDAVMKLVDELGKYYISFKQAGQGRNYISFIPELIVAAYKAGQAPKHIINVLEDLIRKEFFKNVYSEMYNEIGNYINQLQPQVAQYLQQNQPAGQQQGQQANQPNVQQPSQPPANQQPAPQQQQAPQGGQFRQPPSPNVLRP
jgi:hypothetical protein